jgi:hypothetical protein
VTVLRPGIRVSLTLDGDGRTSVRTGDDSLDDELERTAQARGWNLELVADDDVEADRSSLRSATRRLELRTERPTAARATAGRPRAE